MYNFDRHQIDCVSCPGPWKQTCSFLERTELSEIDIYTFGKSWFFFVKNRPTLQFLTEINPPFSDAGYTSELWCFSIKGGGVKMALYIYIIKILTFKKGKVTF